MKLCIQTISVNPFGRLSPFCEFKPFFLLSLPEIRFCVVFLPPWVNPGQVAILPSFLSFRFSSSFVIRQIRFHVWKGGSKWDAKTPHTVLRRCELLLDVVSSCGGFQRISESRYTSIIRVASVFSCVKSMLKYQSPSARLAKMTNTLSNFFRLAHSRLCSRIC